MSVSSAVPEHLLDYAGELLPAEEGIVRSVERLEDALRRFEQRCPEFGFCVVPRGPDIARHAERGHALAEWVAAVGAAFLAADNAFVGTLPWTRRSIDDEELRAYLHAVGAFAVLGSARPTKPASPTPSASMPPWLPVTGPERRVCSGAWPTSKPTRRSCGGALLAVGDLDELADAIDAVRPRPNALLRFLGGARDATVGTVSAVWGLTGQALYDPAGAGRNWGNLGSAVAWGFHDPDDFALAIIDWEGLKDDPARWLGGLAPDAVLAFATAGAGAAVSRGGSATRGVVSTTSRGLRAAKSLRQTIDALRPLSDLFGAGVTDVGARLRTIGGRRVTWTPAGFVDEAGNLTRVPLTRSRGPFWKPRFATTPPRRSVEGSTWCGALSSR